MLHDHETQRSEICGAISMYMLCLVQYFLLYCQPYFPIQLFTGAQSFYAIFHFPMKRNTDYSKFQQKMNLPCS